MGGNVAILGAAACHAGTRKAHGFSAVQRSAVANPSLIARNQGYPSVMAVLVTAIHSVVSMVKVESAWMPAMSAGMTKVAHVPVGTKHSSGFPLIALPRSRE